MISFKLATAAQSTRPIPSPHSSLPLSSRCRRPWPFELNSNFNAILHIQAHYSRLPTYSEPTQSLLNCAFLICRRVQLCLPPSPSPPAWLQKIESRHFAKLRAATELRRIWQRASRLEMDCECRSELRLGSDTHTHTYTCTRQQRIDSRRFRGIRILTFFVQDWEHLQLQLQENNGRNKLRPHSPSGQAGIMRRQSFSSGSTSAAVWSGSS